MSKTKWYIGLGITLLLMVGFTNVANTSTVSDNLLSNNFYDDWSGTNDHFHGPNVLAGVHNEYREQTITLSDHLETHEIQGVTQSQFQAEYWFWNNQSQSVTLTQEIVDSNGTEYNNSITVSGSCNDWNGCGYEDSPTNTIIINDIASDYDITARFSFSVPSRPNYHYAADVRNPELFVTYDPFVLDMTTTQDVEEWLQDFEEEYIDIFEEQELFFIDEPEPFIENFLTFEPEVYELFEEIEYYEPEIEILEELPEEIIDEIIEEMPEEIMEEEIIEEMPEEIVEEIIEELPEEIIEEEPEEISEEPNMEEMPEEIDTSEPEQGDITIGKTIFAKAIEVDQVTFSIMLKEQPIMLDAEFYAPINIYPDQITIFDDRQIYGNISYVANDPVTVHNNLIVGNLERQQELIQKLESMQWRN
tara:strand:+ start:7039 stop:8292 length:1254 start_codon:yes stop_codon:yes gene_type:complete